MEAARDLTTFIVDQATALSQARLKSEQSIRVLDKALDSQAHNALALLNTLPAASPAKRDVKASPSPAGSLIDVLA